jgi:hypothetical protein
VRSLTDRHVRLDGGLPCKHDKYASNSIKTSKYNILTFMPVFLFEMFSRVAYLYFLFQVISPALPSCIMPVLKAQTHTHAHTRTLTHIPTLSLSLSLSLLHTHTHTHPCTFWYERTHNESLSHFRTRYHIHKSTHKYIHICTHTPQRHKLSLFHTLKHAHTYSLKRINKTHTHTHTHTLTHTLTHTHTQSLSHFRTWYHIHIDK